MLCEQLPENIDEAVTYIKVQDSASATGKIAAAFYEHPSQQLKLVGVTGTNGKTTITSLLYQLFRLLKYKVGLISTIDYKIDNVVQTSTHTTPNAIKLNQLLRQMVDAGCTYAFMEVSSHAIHQKRIEGIAFTGGVFTNISHDHLDYHHTFDEYIGVKKAFFDNLPKQAFALTNVDDKRGKVMLQNTQADAHTFGIKSLADFRLKILENQLDGLILKIDNIELHSLLIGKFNASNLLAVYGTAILLGISKDNALTAISGLRPAEGRFDVVSNREKGIKGIVDYAHTPDALDKILININAVKKNGAKVITVCGAGGDRDKTKRPKMAKIAAQNSDKVILTSDNPRTEDPMEILKDMQAGLDKEANKKTVTIENRKEAIRTACLLAQEGDIVLVAGKGHEKYQEINGVRHPFDDKEILTQILNDL